MTDSPPAVRLADVGAQLRRRWRVVAITVAASIVAAMVGALLSPSAYTARAVLTVSSIMANPFGGNQQVNITTERAVVLSSEVATRAAELMESSLPATELIGRISVTSPSDAQVIEIAARAPNPHEAAEIANAFADGYLAVREESVASDVDSRVKRIDERIVALTDELPNGAEAGGGPGTVAIQNEINSLRETRSGLIAMAINPGRVITRAETPETSSSPGAVVFGAGGLAVGLLAGLALALVRERIDPRVRHPERLAAAVGLPVLARRAHGGDEDLVNRLIMRLGLDHDAPLVTVGVLGADTASSASVSRMLRRQLVDAGYDAMFVPWGDRPIEQGLADAAAGGTGGAKVVVISTSAEDGLARTAMLGQRVDKVVVTTLLDTEWHGVTDLIDELSASDTAIDAIVALDAAVGGGGGEEGQPREHAGHDIIDDVTRPAFRPVSPPQRPLSSRRP